MKNILTDKLAMLLLTVIALTGCNQVKLEDQEARNLVVSTLGLPQKFTEEVNANSMDPLGSGRKCQALEDAGFIYKTGNWIYGYNLFCTDKGKPFLIGQGKEMMQGKNTLKFQAFDIDFNQITGIAINKEQQTATVRFTLKATNVSPISRTLEKNIDNPRNGELVYKKFDKGWQLASDQNKTGTDMVREIWWGRH